MCMNCFDKVNQYILIAVSNYFVLVNYLIIFWLHYSFTNFYRKTVGVSWLIEVLVVQRSLVCSLETYQMFAQ